MTRSPNESEDIKDHQSQAADGRPPAAVSGLYLSLFLMSFIFLVCAGSSAAVTLPWSTTFNCPSQAQDASIAGQPAWVTCDGISKYGGWMDAGYPESILPAANNPAGGPGSGQRHWIRDGYHFGSGEIKMVLPAPQSELWIRYYFRYELGFNWGAGGMKMLYLDPGQSGEIHQGLIGVNRFYYHTTADTVANCSTIPPNTILNCSPDKGGVWPVGTGWNYIMRNGAMSPTAPTNHVSDGAWHAIEWHVKSDTNGSNGIYEIIIDGITVFSISNVNFAGHAWQNVIIPENANYPNNAGGPIGLAHPFTSGGATYAEAYMDIDDIAISATGPNGLLGAAPQAPPAAPRGFALK